jgi:hypothetical protein
MRAIPDTTVFAIASSPLPWIELSRMHGIGSSTVLRIKLKRGRYCNLRYTPFKNPRGRPRKSLHRNPHERPDNSRIA